MAKPSKHSGGHPITEEADSIIGSIHYSTFKLRHNYRYYTMHTICTFLGSSGVQVLDGGHGSSSFVLLLFWVCSWLTCGNILMKGWLQLLRRSKRPHVIQVVCTLLGLLFWGDSGSQDLEGIVGWHRAAMVRWSCDKEVSPESNCLLQCWACSVPGCSFPNYQSHNFPPVCRLIFDWTDDSGVICKLQKFNNWVWRGAVICVECTSCLSKEGSQQIVSNFYFVATFHRLII